MHVNIRIGLSGTQLALAVFRRANLLIRQTPRARVYISAMLLMGVAVLSNPVALKSFANVVLFGAMGCLVICGVSLTALKPRPLTVLQFADGNAGLGLHAQ